MRVSSTASARWVGAALAGLVCAGLALADTEPASAPANGDGAATLPAATSAPATLAAPTSAPATLAAPSAPIASHDEAAGAIRVAVYRFDAQDVPEVVAQVVTDNVVSELRKLDGVRAIGMDDIKDMLTHEENKQLSGCEDDSCLAEIAGALGVDELVTGSLSSVGGASVLTARRLDLRRAQVAGTVDLRLQPQAGEEFLAAVGPAVEQLYPQRVLVTGAERGVSEEVLAQLHRPPLPAWVFFGAAGTALTVAALSGGATLAAALSYDEVNRLAQGSVDPGAPLDNVYLADKMEQAQTWDAVRVGLYIGAGVLAAAAGVVALFTDFEGAPEEAP